MTTFTSGLSQFISLKNLFVTITKGRQHFNSTLIIAALTTALYPSPAAMLSKANVARLILHPVLKTSTHVCSN